MYDIILRGGTLVDGTGSERRTGDLAIAGGRIAELGGRISGVARREIDADGLLVTPGFVDLHSHYDGQVTWDDRIDPSFSNGITTTVMGNCGVGFAPARPRDRDRLISLMEGVEAIPGIVLKEGVPWEWEGFPDYLDFLDRRRYGLDIAALMPHAPLRVHVMGERALRHEQATAEDIAAMTAQVREAMAAGAFGLSAGRITEHVYGEDFANVPGTFAEHDELFALADAMAEGGSGIFQLILLGTIGGFGMGRDIGRDARLAEHRLVEAIARRTGRPVHYLLQQFDTDPDDWRMMIGETERAAAEGLDVMAHVASRGFGMMSMLDGYHLFALKPSYREIAGLPLADRVAAMRDPGRRARILAEADVSPEIEPDLTLHGMSQLMTALLPGAYCLGDPVNYEPDESDAVGPVAERSGRTPLAVAYDHFADGDGRGLIAFMFFNYSRRNSDHSWQLLQNPRTLSSLGDGGAHMRLISDASMLPYHLSYWARDRVRGPRLPLEAMVRRITKANADAFGLGDRGELAVGKRADINLIDFDRLRLGQPEMVFDLPAGGGRLQQGATGIRTTILNGVPTREDERDSGARPGRLIRGMRAH
ncbi:N-acyl-D-amino-acid deacylase family protein [Flavisphingomonas formosensis]|uniref:N-acyl-D-amino-acid deacylase family protein n=1 Tax=Flavisphingomonas formosensis TaxID=861534 RepID=UPI0012F98428|nr:amidohydrolase family protein [Sphingomonas formosensis]